MKFIPRNDNVLVRMKKGPTEITTASGIILRGVEQDFHVAEVIAVGPGTWSEDKKTGKFTFITVDCSVGDVVLMEKNFYHEYNIEMRERVEDTIDLPELEDNDFTYHLTKDKDIYLKFESWEDADKLKVHGELYSIMTPKAATRINY